MKKVIGFILNLIFRLFPVNENKIIFQSGRNKIDSNPFAIYDYIKHQKKSNYKCIWLIEKNTNTSLVDSNDCVYYNSIIGLFHLATAKYWIRSQSIGSIIKKRKNQIYIQTWHGAGALKKCEYDCINTPLNERVPMEHILDWDYLIATDKENDKIMRSSVGYNKETLILGNAVTDLLYRKDKKIYNIYKIYNIPKNKKIILYAPTFRDYELEEDYVELPIIKMSEEVANDYVVLLKLHPLISDKIDVNKASVNLINVSDYPIIEHLMLMSDILITDYSSIVFEYGVLNKPIVLYPYDYERYVEERGGFYIDYNKLPGPICYNERDLTDTIINISNYKTKFQKRLREFNTKFNYLNDGNVCKRFLKELKNLK